MVHVWGSDEYCCFLEAPGWCSMEWFQSKQEGGCLQMSSLRVQKQLRQAESSR